jgi:hypothetical protein
MQGHLPSGLARLTRRPSDFERGGGLLSNLAMCDRQRLSVVIAQVQELLALVVREVEGERLSHRNERTGE